MAFINPKTGFVYETPAERAPRPTERGQAWTGLALQSRGQDLAYQQAAAALRERAAAREAASQLGMAGLGLTARGQEMGYGLGTAGQDLDRARLGLEAAKMKTAQEMQQRAYELDLADQTLRQEESRRGLDVERMRDETARRQIEAAERVGMYQPYIGMYDPWRSLEYRSSANILNRQENIRRDQIASSLNQQLQKMRTDPIFVNYDFKKPDHVRKLLAKLGYSPDALPPGVRLNPNITSKDDALLLPDYLPESEGAGMSGSVPFLPPNPSAVSGVPQASRTEQPAKRTTVTQIGPGGEVVGKAYLDDLYAGIPPTPTPSVPSVPFLPPSRMQSQPSFPASVPASYPVVGNQMPVLPVQSSVPSPSRRRPMTMVGVPIPGTW